MIIVVLLIFYLLYKTQRWIYIRFWDTGLTTDIDLSQTETFEGGKSVLSYSISNRKNLPLPGLIVKCRLPGEWTFNTGHVTPDNSMVYHSNLFSPGPYQRIVRNQEMTCHRRGHYFLTSVEITARDLFLSARLSKNCPINKQLLVFPGIIPHVELKQVLNKLNGEIEKKSYIHLDPLAFRGIHEYTGYDDSRYINWNATAKTGAVMVNNYNSTFTGTLRIILNLAPYREHPHPDVPEEGIRLCSSIAEYYCKMGISVSVYSNGCSRITNEPADIPAGSGDFHHLTIARRLAGINTDIPQNPIPNILLRQTDIEPVYLLISSEDTPEVENAFNELRKRGIEACWLWPAFSETKRRLPFKPHIMQWEVREHVLISKKAT